MKIFVQELSSPGCHMCREFENFWASIEKNWPQVEYREIDVTTLEGQELVQKYMIFASPGIIINGQIFSIGGFNREKFLSKLKELSKS